MRATVFLDANVLIPQYLRSIFLDLAHAKLYFPCWTPSVLDEVRRNLQDPTGRYRLRPSAVTKLLKEIERAFPLSMVLNADGLAQQFEGKTDPKDQHVAAGALQAALQREPHSAIVLVTANLRDLPQRAFDLKQVLVATPDQFLQQLLARFPELASDVLTRLCDRLRHPPVTKQVLLQLLDGAGCRNTATALAALWHIK